MRMRRVRVALAQINPTVGAIESNARMIVDWMARARALQADVVAFPELVLTGYPPEDLLFKPAFIEANLRALADVARGSRGFTPVLASGSTVIAANICEDIWYPTGPTTAQALGGAELVITINASPYHAGKARFRERMLATRAADDLVCLAFVNMVGGQDELVFDGQSFIFNEKGERIARGRPFEEDLVVADLDLDEVFRARLHDSRRRKEKLHGDASRPVPRISLPSLDR